MNLTVIGSGYVGLVAGACFAETGNDVICVDLDEKKIRLLSEGVIPIHEPGLESIVKRNLDDGRLRFTTDVRQAVRAADVIFIAVGTPQEEDGSADLQHVLAVAESIGDHMNGEKIVVTKSTVPVGTAARVRATIEMRTAHPVRVCSNPEFLKEGAAVADFMKPDRVVLGVEDEETRTVLEELYSPFVRTGKPILFMDVASAEITKYAANGMLATRISFMNMVARLCEVTGADVDKVRHGVGTDSRIGPHFLFPGIGYGGSCFPKDVKALMNSFEKLDQDGALLRAVEQVNHAQKRWLVERVVERFGEDLSGRIFAAWGLAFKPNTDDMREAPSLTVIDALLERGAKVKAHDPVAVGRAREIYGDRVGFCDVNYQCLIGADALLIHTEWQQYRRPDFNRMMVLLQSPIVFDGRNLYAPERMGELGFEYYSVGRPPVGATPIVRRVP
jgi:UDPglucose 6-dehydrogenase